MRRYAELTWGNWLPASNPALFLTEFDPRGQFIILVGDTPAGIMAVSESSDELTLGKLYLLEEHRNTGIGSSILSSVAAKAETLGVPLRLRTLAVNTRAQAFYLRHGLIIEHRDSERVYFVSVAA